MAALVLLTLLPPGISQAQEARELAGVTIQPGNSVPQAQGLTLRGAGIRSRFHVLKLYVAALYTARPCATAAEVLDGRQAAAVRLEIVSRLVGADRMAAAVEKGFRQATQANTASLQPRLDKLVAAIRSQPIRRGQVFTFVGQPGTGVTVFRNGTKLVQLEGDDFRRTLFAVWLGNHPVDADLKKALLAKHETCSAGLSTARATGP